MIWLPAEGSNLPGVGYAPLEIFYDQVIHEVEVGLDQSPAPEIENAESAQVKRRYPGEREQRAFYNYHGKVMLFILIYKNEMWKFP